MWVRLIMIVLSKTIKSEGFSTYTEIMNLNNEAKIQTNN